MDTERTNKSQGKLSESQKILKDFIGIEAVDTRTIEYAQQCLAIYEETLRAMGLLPCEEISKAVDNSQVKYANIEITEGEYASLSRNY